MKRIILLILLILFALEPKAQKQYNIKINRESIYFYNFYEPLDTFIRNFSKLQFDEALSSPLINRHKITKDDLTNLHKTIVEYIPKADSLNTIWVIYGEKYKYYYSKYLLGPLTDRKKDVFLQINYYENAQSHQIDSLSVCTPKKKCKKIRPLKKKFIESIDSYFLNLKQVIYNNTQDFKATEKALKQIQENRTAIWTIEQ